MSDRTTTPGVGGSREAAKSVVAEVPADGLVQVEAIAQAHLSCGYPTRECDPVTAALAAKLGARETALLSRAIEGYHDPQTRVLIAAASKAVQA